jgi:hypothetical protein
MANRISRPWTAESALAYRTRSGADGVLTIRVTQQVEKL